jgi:hypothetical protein
MKPNPTAMNSMEPLVQNLVMDEEGRKKEEG